MLRWIVRALAILVIVVAALVVLDFSELLVPVEPDDTSSMAEHDPRLRRSRPLAGPDATGAERTRAPATSSPCTRR